MKKFYLILAIAGFVLPLSQFALWLMANGIQPDLLIQEIIESRLSLFAWLDVIITGIVILIWISREKSLTGAKIAMSMAGTLLIGPSFGLPLFLYYREKG